MCIGFYTLGATWTLRVMIWPILRLIQVCPGNPHHLFTCPYLEHLMQFMKRWINHLPIHFLKLIRQEDLLIPKHLLSPLFVDPEAYSCSCVWWHFLFSKEYAQWFQRKCFLISKVIWVYIPDFMFCLSIHQAVQLFWSCYWFIRAPIILVRIYMFKHSLKG